ncbi:hypothetical protein BD779DRAFT_1467199 [Infundibulicybe gibba]|nr:hypothetical protein BD779DRAFT_1467199 [Infundibulicybe gibba]
MCETRSQVSFIGFVTLATTVATGYEAMHMWVENVELATENDPEVKKWQWDLETGKWSGQQAVGGTDPALGFKGRHIVRAAWMSQHWGVGYSTAVIGSENTKGDGLPGPAGINVIDARLQRTEDFLSSAIVLRASRLGQTDAALSWWSRAVALAQGKTPEPSIIATAVIPQTIPPSPLAQRTIASALVSLSAFYAMSGQYKTAQSVEEASLELLKTIHPLPSSPATPPETLHGLYILQRSSLLSVHLAEVLHARRQSVDVSIRYLESAVEASTQVARCRSMNKVASGLLRDARRTAAEAWNLMGILHEVRGSSPKNILNCYEHAIGWAGDITLSAPEAPDGILESEWNIYRENYTRAKQVVDKLTLN